MKRFLTPRSGLLVLLAAGLLAALATAAVVLADDNGDETIPADNPGIAPGEPHPGDDGYAVVDKPAPIEHVGEVRAAESFPVQYFVTVVSGQPGGCFDFAGYTVDRVGNRVIISVTNTVPVDLSAMLCTMEYRTTESNIALGSDFHSGETYIVEVNGEVATEFVAQ